MGKIAKPQRSQKQKKIKAVDPFYHGSRKDKRQEGLNQKPKNFSQEVPRKLRELGLSIHGVRSGKVGKRSKNKFLKHPDGPLKYNNPFSTPLGSKSDKQTKAQSAGSKKETPQKSTTEDALKPKKFKKSKKGSAPAIPDEVFNNYVDNLKPTRQFVEPFTYKKKVHETDASFLRRVNKQTDYVVAKSKIDDTFDVSDEKKMKMKVKSKKGMSDKKKERLKEKKKKRLDAGKEKKREKLKDFSALQDRVEFGDVVHAPPVLSVRPKKAVAVNVDRPGLRMPELKAAFTHNKEEAFGATKKSGEVGQTTVSRHKGKTVKRKALSKSQQVVADAQRDNAIEAYRQMKKKVKG